MAIAVADHSPAQQAAAPGRASSDAPWLRLRGIDKSFPGVRALDSVELELHAGCVTALVGENGAGKSTLVKILTGIYQPDSGRIEYDGDTVMFDSPHAAAIVGITAIHQESVLFDELSVAENIFLGHAPRGRLGLIDRKAMRRRAAEVLAAIEAPIDPDARLKDLGIASKHLVAVARALSVDAQVVIMDEPTAALSHKEVEDLFRIVALLKAEGKAILFISHKFEEVFRLADRYTVFRDGQMVGAGMVSDVSQDQLVTLMVGRSVEQVFPKRKLTLGATRLTVDGFCHPTEFEDISFTVRQGEILGFYGLVGSGRSEFMQALFGITRPSAGSVSLDGDAITIRAPTDAIRSGIVYVPEERARQGSIIGLPIYQNVTLPSLGRTGRSGFLRLAEEFTLTRGYADRLELRAAALNQDIGTLSGGNQQKVVIAKWLATRPRAIILDEPTKGIDIGSKAAVHAFMGELAAEGLSVIMVSSELPEILGISDRIVVMRQGRMVGTYDRAEVDAETLVRAASGIAETVR
ncbi:MAG: sugar ABC transporter ATP-binding protein [Inquilinus sp.]|nr:sugar ABC transporter ATP-binding protein [Inquilinus sp.]